MTFEEFKGALYRGPKANNPALTESVVENLYHDFLAERQSSELAKPSNQNKFNDWIDWCIKESLKQKRMTLEEFKKALARGRWANNPAISDLTEFDKENLFHSLFAENWNSELADPNRQDEFDDAVDEGIEKLHNQKNMTFEEFKEALDRSPWAHSSFLTESIKKSLFHDLYAETWGSKVAKLCNQNDFNIRVEKGIKKLLEEREKDNGEKITNGKKITLEEFKKALARGRWAPHPSLTEQIKESLFYNLSVAETWNSELLDPKKQNEFDDKFGIEINKLNEEVNGPVRTETTKPDSGRPLKNDRNAKPSPAETTKPDSGGTIKIDSNAKPPQPEPVKPPPPKRPPVLDLYGNEFPRSEKDWV